MKYSLTRYDLETIIATARPLHDDLVRSLALEVLMADERIAELEARVKELSDTALRYAQSGAAINLSWILNLDKLPSNLSPATPNEADDAP